ECRIFKEKWTTSYLFTEMHGKPLCLVCLQQVSVLKEYNIRCHYETHHSEKYDGLQGQLRRDKINELLAGLRRCMMKAAELVCPEKRQAFANISLARNTIAERISELSADLDSQLKQRVKSFIAFSVAIDESTDVDWSRAVSLATDGAPAMVGKKAGVATKFKDKVQALNGGDRFWTCRGAVLRHFFDLREEIGQFMEKKGKPVLELQSQEWLRDLAFLVDITEHLNNLNKMLQGRKKVVTQFSDNIHAFKLKLTLWEMQLANGNPAHFPCLRDVCVTRPDADMKRYKDKIAGLLREFEKRFQVFGELETEFSVFRSPFTVKASDLPVEIQLEIIDLQCDADLKGKFASVGLDRFDQYLLPGYPKLTALAAKILCMFGTTYLCEQIFSVMNINKTKIRSRLTNKHLNDILKVTA
uniref:SPIN-DOC-like zinc-finger domain-containing protein n=1 Tax=Gasterosteus aculeatus TaxID=69293 RepID=G3Q0J7_GASAC